MPNRMGKNVPAFVTVEDISLHKKQEEKLRVLSLIAEDNINAVIIADSDGRIEWINKSFTRMTGFELEEVRQKKTRSCFTGG